MTDKHLKHIHACPKCGNEKGLMVIPGQGAIFYYCPACYERDKKPTEAPTPEVPEAVESTL